MASNLATPFLVLVTVIFAVGIYLSFAPALLGSLGDVAADSPGVGDPAESDSFAVEEESVDRGAGIALVQIPSLVIGSVGVWALLALLLALAYVGVV